MAALAYLFEGSSGSREPDRARQKAHLLLLGSLDEPGDSPQRHAARPTARVHGARRFLPGVVTLIALVGLWFGAGALAAVGRSMPSATQKGLLKVDGGYAYVVRPGDTLWSIATRLVPSADPRPLVDRLAAELHGTTLRPGEVIVVP